ncbi:MAG: N(4)-(beta-N-acetylglucosaminyl)-L-asparaginase [Planctomycetota bacterium]
MSNPPLDRRSFLLVSAAALPAASSASLAKAVAAPAPRRLAPASPVAISSGNGQRAVNRAVEQMEAGTDPLDAVVAGVSIVEADPDDMSVGFGGLPNEQGVVELDASVMHGPTHKAGAVAGIQKIKHPSQVALKVCRTTDHVMLVGAGALAFARAHGFQEENLLTEKARQAWLRWKSNLSPFDDWLDDDQQIDSDPERRQVAAPIPHTHGTIHCAGVNERGDIGAVTTTSGLSYKIPGRVGDSPIIGAGMFVDNAVGAAGATGRGEAVIQSCGAFQVVQHMATGDEPVQACLKVLQWIVDHTRRADLRTVRDEPNFQVTLYALRKDGAYGSACLRKGGRFTVHDADGSRVGLCSYLYE